MKAGHGDASRPLVPALGRQRQVGFCEVEASMVYKGTLRTARDVTQRNPYLKKQEHSEIICQDQVGFTTRVQAWFTRQKQVPLVSVGVTQHSERPKTETALRSQLT